jgi:hypothetical protein
MKFRGNYIIIYYHLETPRYAQAHSSFRNVGMQWYWWWDSPTARPTSRPTHAPTARPTFRPSVSPTPNQDVLTDASVYFGALLVVAIFVLVISASSARRGFSVQETSVRRGFSIQETSVRRGYSIQETSVRVDQQSRGLRYTFHNPQPPHVPNIYRQATAPSAQYGAIPINNIQRQWQPWPTEAQVSAYAQAVMPRPQHYPICRQTTALSAQYGAVSNNNIQGQWQPWSTEARDLAYEQAEKHRAEAERLRIESDKCYAEANKAKGKVGYHYNTTQTWF